MEKSLSTKTENSECVTVEVKESKENTAYKDDSVGKIMLEFSSGSLDLSSKELSILPSQICNGLGACITDLLLDFNDLTCFPDNFGEYCTSLKVLSVTGNQLKILPSSIGKLSCLQELLLNENEIENFPDSFCDIVSLKILKVRCNKLNHLPENIGKLQNLEVLYAEENCLETLPPSIGHLWKLKLLELGDNQMKYVPAEVGNMESLQILDLCNNKLEDVPESLGDLCLLELLDLSGNHLENLPKHMKSSLSIRKLYCDRNRLESVPDWVSELENVTEVSMSNNSFYHQQISEEFGSLCQKLIYLDFGGNFMDKLPDSIGHLRSLEKLYLGSCIPELERRAFQNGNWLTYLPESFCDLVNLREIHLDENLLQELPSAFGNLVNLEFIDLGQNLLHELPDSFGALRSLKVCQLSKNKLQILPSTFGALSSLEDLRLDNNLLEELPESFKDLTELKTLDLFNNKLTEIPDGLKYFTKLVRMDLSENHFSIPWHEVPQVVTKAKYPPRDPSKKDNWRGRPRQDLSMLDDKIIKVNQTLEDLDFEPPPKDLGYNENAMKDAALANMSIWRSHTGPQSREKFVHRTGFRPRHPNNYSSGNNRNSDSEDENDDDDDQEWNHIHKDDDDNEDDDFEPPIFQPKKRLNERESTPEETESTPCVITSEENWDDELEEVEDPYYKVYDYNYFNNIYQHPKPKTLEEAGYKVDEHLFLPYDIHGKPVVVQKQSYQVEEGQFDDVSEDES